MNLDYVFLIARIIIWVVLVISFIIWIIRLPRKKYFPILLEKLDGTLKEKQEDSIWSLIRVKAFGTFLISNIVFWGVFLSVTILSGRIAEVPDVVGAVYLGINGIESLTKALQKKFEQ
jgi:uncharacterized RDD family membrane protein YckC